MNISVKNIDEEDWRLIKSEAARHKLNIGRFLSRIAIEYKKRGAEENNWNEVLYGRKLLNQKDAGIIRETIKEIRKEFEFR